MISHPYLFLHGNCKQYDEVHDENRPENRNIEELEESASQTDKNCSKRTVPGNEKTIKYKTTLFTLT